MEPVANSYQSFTDLLVWQEARKPKNAVYQLVQQFPHDEKFRLCDQMIRSSRSVTDTIAEGHGRFTFKDQLHFCIQARGSLTELHNHFFHAADCKFISQETFNQYVTEMEKVHKLLNGYISFLRSKTK